MDMFKKRKKDNRSYKNFKYWPTAKLKEVIDEPYNRGVDGHDYYPYIDEIKSSEWCYVLARDQVNGDDI